MKRILLGLALFGLPVAAFAADMQFVVYNAFDETVMAFQRLALITSDSEFVMLAGCFIAVSVVFGSLVFSAKGTAGQAGNPMTLLIPLAVGVALFFGAVVPKGRMFIYDQTLNKTQVVGGVPDLIVFVAGTLNAVEREVTRMVDTAAATPYATDVGALSFSAILAASTSTQGDVLLERSIGRYMSDCGLTAIGVAQNGTTMNDLMRNSDDLFDTLSNYSHPAWPTTWYPPASPGGEAGVCADSWTYIKGRLSDATSTGPSAQMRAATCSQIGMDVTDAGQLTACNNVLGEVAELYGSAGMDQMTLMRQFVIAKGIMNMMMDPDMSGAQSALTNQRMMAEGFGTDQALDQWVPKIRGLMLALVLGITPIALMFLMTNLVYSAIGVVIGMYAFLAIWGICDAISVQMAKDAAVSAFTSIAAHKVSYESMMTAPSAAVQGLALFGKFRMMALAISAALSAALFKFSSMAFDSGAHQLMQGVGDRGGQAGIDTMTPTGVQNQMSGLMHSTDAVSTVMHGGAGNAMSSSAMAGATQASAHSMYLDSVTRGGRSPEGFDQGLEYSAAAQAGDMVGRQRSLAQVSSDLGASPMSTATSSAKASDFGTRTDAMGRYEGAERAASFAGDSVTGTSIGSASATSARSSEQTLTQQSTDRTLFGGPNGDLEAARVSGGKTSSDVHQTSQMADRMRGADSTQRLANLSGLEKGSESGLIGATDGSAPAATGMYETQHRISLAETGVQGGHERSIGTGRGRDSIVSGDSTNSVWSHVGPKAMTEGAEVDKASHAYTGQAFQDAGGVYPNAEDTAHRSAAQQIAQARISKDLGRALGYPPGIQGQIQFQRSANGNISTVLANDGHRGAAVDAMLKSGAINQSQADEINSMAGPARLDFGYVDGQIGAVKAVTASDVASGNTIQRVTGTTDKAGDTFQRGDSTTAGNSVQVAQATSFGGKSANDTVYSLFHAYGGDMTGRAMPDSFANVLADAYANRAQQGEGYSLSGEAGQQTVDTVSWGGRGNLSAEISSGRAGAPQAGPQVPVAEVPKAPPAGSLPAGPAGWVPPAAPPTGAGAAPVAPAGAFGGGFGVEGGANHQENWTGGHTASADAFRSGMREALTNDWHESQQAVARQFGPQESWTPEVREQANRALAEQVATRGELSYQKLIGVAVDRTLSEQAAAQGHNSASDKLDSLGSSARTAWNEVKGLF